VLAAAGAMAVVAAAGAAAMAVMAVMETTAGRVEGGATAAACR